MSESVCDCVICLEPMETDETSLEEEIVIQPFDCEHRLHSNCFKQYVEYNRKQSNEDCVKCPLCQGNVKIKTGFNYFSIVYSFCVITFLSIFFVAMIYFIYDILYNTYN
uniref:RING-type domain-containing protein n=1 Tax=Pyramimonas orientalis virus TaxID=455367 RepID=A0A7M3UP67_POV01|nr:hypothetical protein HWQ62_00403 [Pyramimonas orientalis virus]